MTRFSFPAVMLALCLHSGSAAAVPLVLQGDILTGALPIAALSVAYFKSDGEGGKQWLRNTSVNAAINSIFRLGFEQTSLGRRPDGGGGYGFPSGHAGFVFAQAAFLQDRYGWKYGVPAYLAATYVGYIRVATDNHHERDVIAAALLSYGVTKLFVTPEKATHLAPVIGPDFLGMRWERSF